MTVEQARETAGITTRLTVEYVRERAGESGVAAMLDRAGIQEHAEELCDDRRWWSYATRVALLEAAADVLDDVEAPRRIGASALHSEAPGPVRAVLTALGSPARVFQLAGRANSKFSTVSSLEAVEVTANRARLRYRIADGYEPSQADCRYSQGLLSQVPALFGLPSARVVEEACQLEGDEACIYELRWVRRRGWLPWRRRADSRDSEMLAAALRARVVDLEHSVEDLVSSQDLHEVLESIARRASSAVRAPRHLLAVRLPTESTPRIHADGFNEEERERLGRALLRSDGAEVAGNPSRLLAPVASARNRHGWLLAEIADDTGFLPEEQEHLVVYARLAATALDAASALEEARHRGEINEALLTLGLELAHQRDEQAIARRVVTAAPTVLDASRSSLLLLDDTGQRLKVVAAHRFGVHREAMEQLVVPMDASPTLSEIATTRQPTLYTRAHPDPFIRGILEQFDGKAMVAAPVIVENRFDGLLVTSWWLHDTTLPPEAALLRGAQSLAEQAGTALANHRLLARTRHQATHDALTGLAGRTLLRDRLERLLNEVERTGRTAALAFLDLDRFKAVNDTFGHHIGDALLVEVAERLRRCLRGSDSVARMAGDEFAVLLHNVDGEHGVRVAAERIVESLREPFRLGEHTAEVGASVGIALLPHHGQTPEALLTAADAAMYAAKRQGAGYQFYLEDLAS